MLNEERIRLFFIVLLFCSSILSSWRANFIWRLKYSYFGRICCTQGSIPRRSVYEVGINDFISRKIELLYIFGKSTLPLKGQCNEQNFPKHILVAHNCNHGALHEAPALENHVNRSTCKSLMISSSERAKLSIQRNLCEIRCTCTTTLLSLEFSFALTPACCAFQLRKVGKFWEFLSNCVELCIEREVIHGRSISNKHATSD